MSVSDQKLLKRHEIESRKVVNFKEKDKKFTASSLTSTFLSPNQRAELKEQLTPIRRSLPIFEHRETLVNAIRHNQNLVLVGETGSGKTTQIPQYLYEEGLAHHGTIAVTQPRRVAAMTVADRVAQEVGVKLGNEVGYTIRFEDYTNEQTKIKYMTDGMLLREIQVDPMLRRYTIILLDEAHERTLNTDILFALLKQLQTKRPKLKIIAMSATLDAGKFSTYFNNAPVAIVPGRTFKVDSYFAKEEIPDMSEATITSVLQLHQDKPLDGDILVFMSGSDEIEAAKRGIEERAKGLPHDSPKLIVYPLYSTLAPDVQLEAFKPTPVNTRKVVVSTNIAETSITLHGIKYVVDTGRAKVKTFHSKTGLETLAEQIISRAEAFQRSGRSGREREGECYRLYPEEFFKTMPPSVEPEILRTPMTAAVLQLKALGINDIKSFDFIDRPSTKILKKATLELLQLEAIDAEGKITMLGRAMVEFPIEPCYSRILIAAACPPTVGGDSGSLALASVRTGSLGANVAKVLGFDSDDSFKDDITKKNKKDKKNQKDQQNKEQQQQQQPQKDELEKKKRKVEDTGIPVFEQCSDEMATLIAALSVDSLQIIPDRGNSAQSKRLFAKYMIARHKFFSKHGDLITLLEILRQYEAVLPARRDQWCKEYFVNPRNAAMALKVREQLLDIMKTRGYPIVSCRANAERARQLSLNDTNLAHDEENDVDIYEPVRKCLITGLSNKIIKRQYDGTYTMLCGTEASLHPSSSLHGVLLHNKKLYNKDGTINKNAQSLQAGSKGGAGGVLSGHQETKSKHSFVVDKHQNEIKEKHPYECLLYHEVVFTTKNYVRSVCAIDEDWLYEIAPHTFEREAILETEKSKALKQFDEYHTTKHSHTNTLIQGQRTAFADLQSKQLPSTVSLSVSGARSVAGNGTQQNNPQNMQQPSNQVKYHNKNKKSSHNHNNNNNQNKKFKSRN